MNCDETDKSILLPMYHDVRPVFRSISVEHGVARTAPIIKYSNSIGWSIPSSKFGNITRLLFLRYKIVISCHSGVADLLV